MIRLIRVVGAGTARLAYLERNPDPATPLWEREVEDALLGPVGLSHYDDPVSAVLVADEAGSVIGAALHYPHEALVGAQYVAAVMIDHRHRGRGLGAELLTAVVADALAHDPDRAHAAWVVHPDNAAMLHVSNAVGDRVGTTPAGYVMFVADRSWPNTASGGRTVLRPMPMPLQAT